MAERAGSEGGETPRRTAGRPRRGSIPIDSTRIGLATLDVLVERGAKGVSISSIANKLGVRSQTLYYYVASVNEAVNMARGVVMSRIDATVLERGEWDASVGAFGLEYYRAFAPLGQENSAFFLFEITDGKTLQMYEKFISRAMREGVGGQDALQLLLDVEHMIFSLIFEHSSWSSLFSPSAIAAEGRELLESLLKAREISPASIELKVHNSALGLARIVLSQDSATH